MLKKLLAIMLVFALAGSFGLFVGGCGDKDDSPKSLDDYRQQAEKEIDDANVEAELENIQKEIEAETE